MMFLIHRPRWVEAILLCSVFKVALLCAEECCCAVSDDKGVDCSGSDLPILPPRPTANEAGERRRWCGRPPGAGGGVTKIDLKKSSASEISPEMFKNYPNLEILILDNCKLTSLAKNTFTSPGLKSFIQNISVRSNNIQELEKGTFTGLNNLKELDLSWNVIKTLRANVFTPLVNLTALYLNGNQISLLNMEIFTTLISLRRLDLSGNPIRLFHQQFPRSLVQLSYLLLRNTSISQLDPDVFKNLRSLGQVDLSSNNLEKLPEEIFSNKPDLYKINLSFNKLKDLSRTIFSGLCNLVSLDLRHNRLTTVHYEWFATVANQTRSQIRDRPAMEGNPLDCKMCYRHLVEYAFFLTQVCEDPIVKLNKLSDHLNVVCESGKQLINTSTCSTTLRYECVNYDRSKIEILSRNKNGSCAKNPYCRFLSPKCAMTEKKKPIGTPPAQPQLSTGDTMPYVFVGVGILTVICVALVIRGLRNKHKDKTRQIAFTQNGFPNRRPGDGSSDCASTTSSGSSSFSNISDESSNSETSPKELYPNSAAQNTQPKDIFHRDETQPKILRSGNPNASTEPRTQGSERLLNNHNFESEQTTQPKEVAGNRSPDETRRKSPHFSNYPNASRTTNLYAMESKRNGRARNTQPKKILTSEQNHPGNNTSTQTNMHCTQSNIRQESEYMFMKPQCGGNAPSQCVPDTNSFFSPMANILPPDFSRQPQPNCTDPLFQLASQTQSHLDPVSHQYTSIPSIPYPHQEPSSSLPEESIWIPPLPAPMSTHQRNEYADEIQHGLPRPDPHPNCHLRYPKNPVHVPYVIYRDHRQPRERHRSDMQLLLDDSTNQSGKKTVKKQPKTKKKKKKAK